MTVKCGFSMEVRIIYSVSSWSVVVLIIVLDLNIRRRRSQDNETIRRNFYLVRAGSFYTAAVLEPLQIIR